MITEEYLTEESGEHQVPEMAREPFMAEMADTVPDPDPRPMAEIRLPEAENGFNYRLLLLLIPLLPFCACIGLGSGLLVGWELWPVQWDASEWHGATPANLTDYYLRHYIQALSDRHAYDSDADTFREAAQGTKLLPMICFMMSEAGHAGNTPEAIRLYALTNILGGCDAIQTSE